MRRTRHRLVTAPNGVPLAPGTVRHNAYVMGWEDGAMDAYDGSIIQLHRNDEDIRVNYTAGFEAGRAARAVAFEEARNRKSGPPC